MEYFAGLDVSLRSCALNYIGMRFLIYVGDFGLADAFRDFGRNSGSRPYMAPEQFDSDPCDLTAENSFDIFALSVISHECFLDGLHPIGVVTNDVWPWRDGIPRKWDRKRPWRNWAQSEKTLPAASQLPTCIAEIIYRGLKPEPSNRPSINEFEDALWTALRTVDPSAAQSFEVQVIEIEKMSVIDEPWPHMEDCLRQLREFYSRI
jgi:serine/threonine protein kinase